MVEHCNYVLIKRVGFEVFQGSYFAVKYDSYWNKARWNRIFVQKNHSVSAEAFLAAALYAEEFFFS